MIERLYGVSVGPYNRPKDISNLFNQYPQLYSYFFEILNSKTVDQRVNIVFQFFLESQVGENISKDCYAILNCFQLVFMDYIKQYENHYGQLSVRSFVALCHIQDIPAVVYDIKSYIETNWIGMKKNILKNFILLLQELYKKIIESSQYTLNSDNIVIVENCLSCLANFLNLSDLSLFYPVLYSISFFEATLLKIKNLKCESNYLDRIWLNNNLSFLLFNVVANKMWRICDVILSSKLPSFAQIKILNIIVYKFEKKSFQKEDVEKILQVLFKNTIAVDNRNNFLLGSFLKVILVLANSYPEMDIVTNIPVISSDNLFRNMVFLVYVGLTRKTSPMVNTIKNNKFIERIIGNIAISEEMDNDILSVISYAQKISFIDNFSYCKLIFYFCTNESTYLDAHSIVSFNWGKNFCSILTLLKNFFHPNHLGNILEKSDITKLYKDLNNSLKSCRTSYRENETSYYQIEGDELIAYDILQKLISYLNKEMNYSIT